MKFAHFFIQRPIFAGVLSVLVLLLGLIAMMRLPISEYPEVVPPTIVVMANYPGANPKTIAETVAAPLEQAVNGVENALYMFSQATSDGVLTLTVTFKLGTRIDDAQVQVQNRVAQALPKLPEEVRRLGVTTTKQSPDLTMVVHLMSPDGRYDEIYLRNYATLQVKDVLARIPGAGSVQLFGSGDYAMRVWIDPDQAAARDLTASDIVQALREQNVQIAAGAIGQQPLSNPVGLELQINAKGRLLDPEEFGNVIIKTGPNGEKTFLKSVARIELGASGYSLRSLLNNRSAVAIPIFQSPGANALQLSEDVRRTMDELKKNFPEGLDYAVVYDPTVFVRSSIRAVVKTLFEAVFLVVVVVILFLQTWRASIIPLAAVPVSLVGTFAVMLALGFSINMLTLFGLVLAIGIVVDDAIVVVENVERNIALGFSPVEATKRAMDEVTGPIIAIALVLCAVFIPTAFISGLTGQFYKQFAITIAISTVISAFNSLTLSPALSAVLLRSHHAPKDGVSRMMDRLFGWLFRPFNVAFSWAGDRYGAAVAGVLRKSAAALVIYLGLVGLTGWSFTKVPTGFVPTQDKQYLVAFAQLPDGASLDRTDAVMRRMSDLGLKVPGVQDAVQFPGLSISGFSVAPNAGIIFFGLKPFEERKGAALSGPAIAAALNREFGGIQDAFILTVMPPPVNGLGTIGGFKMFVEDRAGLGYDALYQTTQALIGQGYGSGKLAGLFSTFTVNVPQLDAEIDRVKAKSQGVPLQTLFETMQVYLGSLYVNDFNLFGRTWQVVAQADSRFRDRPEDITRLKTRNLSGQMVPLGAVVTVKESYGPDRVMRYNGYPAAEINGGPAQGISSGQAESLMARLASEQLPKGYAFEWTDLTFQRILAGNSAVYVYPLCILLVFLVLAAQYESFRLPLAIILVVPLCLLFAIAGVWLTGGDNNIFTQIGLIVLVGLACKNAILIVEFAKHKQDVEGLSPSAAAIEACRLRLRPILMTSIAFIAGVFPLVVSTGAGSEMRRAMGVAVFSGMIGVTLFGLLLTPVFYVVLMRLGATRKPSKVAAVEHPLSPPPGSTMGGAHVAGWLAFLVAAGSLLSPTAEAWPLTVGPDYKRPTNAVPQEFRDAPTWKEAGPSDARSKGSWWVVFQDRDLDLLMERATTNNWSLKAAAARFDQARAAARVSKSEWLPQVDLNPSLRRERFSDSQDPDFGIVNATTLRTPLDLSYEVDLWGRVRRSFQSARADAQASAADFHNALLSIQAEVARYYFSLRAVDRQRSVVRESIGLRREARSVLKGRVDAGTAPELDLARADTEVAVAEAELVRLEQQRNSLASALSVLTGSFYPEFELEERSGMAPTLPPVPEALPSDLLERRPDVASAERHLASANARIGMAKAAFFPVLRLTGSAGYASAELDALFSWESRVWSLGPSLSLPIFAGGRNRANLARARSAFDEAVANYRQQVLIAFAEVQELLTAHRLQAEEAEVLQRTHDAAHRTYELARARYEGGIVSYLEVIESQRTLLAVELDMARLHGQRQTVLVQLIKALGGGWHESIVLAVQSGHRGS
ncbi:MAG: multidrug efflux RND transporter permease subunit [Verrucomicrobiales bacterium]|nr:multidrug efflux RND transporter permease subunit [Verrucomicrobiales bacterium]